MEIMEDWEEGGVLLGDLFSSAPLPQLSLKGEDEDETLSDTTASPAYEVFKEMDAVDGGGLFVDWMEEKIGFNMFTDPVDLLTANSSGSGCEQMVENCEVSEKMAEVTAVGLSTAESILQGILDGNVPQLLLTPPESPEYSENEKGLDLADLCDVYDVLGEAESMSPPLSPPDVLAASSPQLVYASPVTEQVVIGSPDAVTGWPIAASPSSSEASSYISPQIASPFEVEAVTPESVVTTVEIVSPESLFSEKVQRVAKPRKPRKISSLQNRKERKKEQNKTAALRYRNKKRAESESMSLEQQELEEKNVALKKDVSSLGYEIDCLKKLMKDIPGLAEKAARIGYVL